ncbi:hypothetical protein C8R48DRAFT_769482 [Suillus tomentosus]|nr:hypothetical protein C8R48DRAFT_769482 [Suillus tomentosus]
MSLATTDSSQVVDFEEAESEWAIDKILAHSSRHADSTFQILWKKGDASTLPYDQVAELDALKDYFSVLGINDVSELGEGAGNPPNEGSQVTVGHLSLASVGYKEPISVSSTSKNPFIQTTHNFLYDFITRAARTTLPTTMAPILTRIRARRFTLPNGLGDGDLMVVLNMLRVYLEHDAHLRVRDFSLSLNMLQTTNRLTSRFAEESSEGPRISGPSPSLTDLIGEEVPPAPPIYTSASQPPSDGRWLSSRRAELMEEALWMNLETSKRQREWCDRSIAERKAAKCTHHAMSSPPDHQPTNRGEGSSGRHTGSTPHSNTSATPHLQSQMEVDNDETRTHPSESTGGDTEKGAKGKARAAKK